ncbi:MAG: response regulator [bacterium]
MVKRDHFSILVADESAECRDAFRDTLEPKGYDVTSAGSGREAVDVIVREPVDLVVMDLRLPDYSGVEIYHAIKDIRRAFLPCIFTALETSTRSLQEALSEDAITILPKPVDCGRLVHAVDWSIDRYYMRGRPGSLRAPFRRR